MSKDREKYFKNFYPPGRSYDWELAYCKENSEYYARLVKQMGQKMADYYWNRREAELDPELRLNVKYTDYLYVKECKEIIEKCDKFLRSRGVDPRINFNNQAWIEYEEEQA